MASLLEKGPQVEGLHADDGQIAGSGAVLRHELIRRMNE